jgi:hypothetical protein
MIIAAVVVIAAASGYVAQRTLMKADPGFLP